MPANVLTIPAGAPFAETLTRGLIARYGTDDPLALAGATIYLPTQRAIRTLAEIFAKELGGAALLPDLRALGDADDDDILLALPEHELALRPAITPMRQQLLLATLVKKWKTATGSGTLSFAQAANLARGLAGFLADIERQNADLAKLDDLAPADLAAHWAEVHKFLCIVRDSWPAILEEEGTVNPTAHRNAALARLAERFTAQPPQGPVIAAGSTGSIPATAKLLGVIANLPGGAVILPGLDRELDEKSWAALDAGHPQFGMKQLLSELGVARKDVIDWAQPLPQTRARVNLLREILRPAPTTDAWRAIAKRGGADVTDGLKGLSLIEAAGPGEEAAAIALILREALEKKDQTAALITPDRNLARRVSVDMARWGLAIDDSAGRPLAKTPPGAFLCLLAEAADAQFAPVHLLALLKHPLASGGEDTPTFRRHVRELDRCVLRGARPDPGFAGIATAMKRARDDAQKYNKRLVAILDDLKPWLDNLAALLKPLEALFAKRGASIDELLQTHVAVAEALAATDDIPGAARLWAGDAGEAAANLVANLGTACEGIADIEPGSYPPLFRSFAESTAVRMVRGSHPRLAILGLQEARLQSFDVIVLGGLNEGTWPSAASTDPWLSRPMRETLGLEPPERAIGLSAHDFATLAAGPNVILTRARKAEGSPTIASRWLQRLEQFTRGLGFDENDLNPPQDYMAIANALSEPERAGERIARPAPTPPVEARPTSLSVTEIETWQRDPYAIYAKHVLGLRPLDALDLDIGPLERGNAIHVALENFIRETKDSFPDDAQSRLIAHGEKAFKEAGVPKAAMALWWPRFLNAAHWFVAGERERRANIRQSFVEISGSASFPAPNGEFSLRCKADRIDILLSGGAAIVDYKTGAVPAAKQVRVMLSPQLPLEGAILAKGGFKEIGTIDAAEMLYIGVKGDAQPGKIVHFGDETTELVAKAEEKLRTYIDAFANIKQPYWPRVIPFRKDFAGDYDHLARVREWSFTGWEGDEE